MPGKIAGSAMKAIMMNIKGMILPGLTCRWQQAGLCRFSFKENAFHGVPPDEIFLQACLFLWPAVGVLFTYNTFLLIIVYNGQRNI